MPQGSCDAAPRHPKGTWCSFCSWIELTLALSFAKIHRDRSLQKFTGTVLMSPFILLGKRGGWQLHYPLLWRRLLHIMALLSPSRAVSPALIAVFPCNFWFSPCPSSPSAYSDPVETRARLSLPQHLQQIKAKHTKPPRLAPFNWTLLLVGSMGRSIRSQIFPFFFLFFGITP